VPPGDGTADEARTGMSQPLFEPDSTTAKPWEAILRPDEDSPQPWVPAPQDPIQRRAQSSVALMEAPPQPVSQTSRGGGFSRFVDTFSRFVDASKPRTPSSAMEGLRNTLPPDRLIGWVVTLVITGLAFFIRWFRLGQPDQIMFDETYYAKDAWSILQLGYEGSWPDGSDEIKAEVNQLFAQGSFPGLNVDASWASHPEVGKFMIAAGLKLFGLNAFGWRVGALVFGTLLVLLTIRLARRLSHSTLIGGLAGLLVTVDGMSFVMSRIALLDIFQAVFILGAVACVVADRDFFRNRLADHLATLPGNTLNGRAGPLIFRPWLLGAGVMFGLAFGTKWNSAYPIAVFGILVVVWSLSARRLAGARTEVWWGLLKDGVPAFVSMVIVSAVVYLVTWIPWLMTFPGHKPGWGGAVVSDNWVAHHFGQRLGLLWDWHIVTYDYHTGTGMEQVTHSYASNPWGWPVMARTTGIYAQNGIQPGDQGCHAAAGDTCLRVITALGTPLLWWLAVIALLAGLVWWLAGMDWRFGVAILGMASTWVPWIISGRGAKFTFYTITMAPFMCIALAMVMGVILGRADAGQRRKTGAIIVGVATALIVLDFAFMYPIYSAGLMTRKEWQWRMWLPGWV